MSKSNLPRKLADLRRRHGYTQSYVGNYLNISRQGYAHYEHGTRNPDYQSLFQLASLYEISLDELLSDSDVITTEHASEDASYSTAHSDKFELPKHEQKEIIELLSQLTPAQRDDYKILLKSTVQNNIIRKKKR